MAQKSESSLTLFCDVLEYALGCNVPTSFAAGLLERREAWDEEFVHMITSTAHEFRDDMVVWELEVDATGKLHERRISLYELLVSG